jgi:hypothetical protein
VTQSKPPDQKSFFATLPGVITAIGGAITAIAALLTAMINVGVIGHRPPTVTAVVSAAPSPGPTVIVIVLAPTPVPTPLTEVPPVATVGAADAPTPTTTPKPTRTPAVTVTPTSDVLFADNFDDTSGGWLADVTDKVEKGYVAGEYRFTVHEPKYAAWAYPKPPREFGDFVIEADARYVTGPLENEYGLLLRSPENEDGFYVFLISSNGRYAVQKYENSDWTDLVEWTTSPAVRTGKSTNHLRVACQGSKMRFFVNAAPVAEVDNSRYSSGNIGILASSEDKGGVAVAFDNVRVSAIVAP